LAFGGIAFFCSYFVLLLNITPKAFVTWRRYTELLMYPCLLNSLENTEKALLEIENQVKIFLKLRRSYVSLVEA
jgi:hypothetical protein